jgi:hypothetical protein
MRTTASIAILAGFISLSTAGAARADFWESSTHSLQGGTVRLHAG